VHLKLHLGVRLILRFVTGLPKLSVRYIFAALLLIEAIFAVDFPVMAVWSTRSADAAENTG